MSDHSGHPDRTPFERFTEAMKRILGTPKAEVEKRDKEGQRRKATKKRSR